MTDQRQSTHDKSAPPAHRLERAGPHWTGPASSTQDHVARDSTDADRPADDGAGYRSAAYDLAVDEPDVHESVADGNADERGADERTTEHPAGDGESLDAVDGPVPAGDADLDHVDPEHAVGVASVPDAEPAPGPEADTVDRGGFDSPGAAAQHDVPTDAPDGAYGINRHPADVPGAVEELEVAGEHDGVDVGTDTGQPVDVDEGAEVAGGETPIVPVPMDDSAPPDVIRPGEMLPGDLPEEPGLALFDGETTERFRDRWRELQLRFVDDPHAAEGQAVALVDEVVTALRDAVDQQRSALRDWQAGRGVDANAGDTEQTRVAVRRYRDFLDRLLAV
jgi:hypothetical protein